ncbi:UBP-type zinc finger domain-containing protein [Pyxidicoccus sp. 3LG]
MAEECEHVEQAGNPPPRAAGCEECLASGSGWVHLRRCLDCGHIGCCDSSPNTHATKHFHQTHHPIIQSFEPGEDWMWCYEDEVFVEHRPSHDEARP